MKFLPESRGELGSSIRHGCFGNPMKTNDTRHVFVSQLVGSVGSADRNKVCNFGQPVNNNPNGIMPSVGLGQASYEIHTNLIPFPLGNLKGLKQSGRSLVLSLHSLTNVTVLDE